MVLKFYIVPLSAFVVIVKIVSRMIVEKLIQVSINTAKRYMKFFSSRKTLANRFKQISKMLIKNLNVDQWNYILSSLWDNETVWRERRWLVKREVYYAKHVLSFSSKEIFQL